MKKENEQLMQNEKEMQQVCGGNGPTSPCKHPGCFELNERHRLHNYDYGYKGGISGSSEDCCLCKHWGADGPCDLD